VAKKKKPIRKVETSVENSIPTSVKELLSPPTPVARSRAKPSDFRGLKIIGGVLIALMLGAGILTFYTGQGKKKHGSLDTGRSCQLSEDCRDGDICFADKGVSPVCTKMCRSDSDCDAGKVCLARGILGKKSRVKLSKVCVNDDRP